ncbi:hypothetical protein BN1708_015394 [Verticillium longisporum]|uniref:TOM core complex subunit Tom6 n=1 Tax=Verticillium longisporum TaxID=100787 RepID=A0A0G4M3S2_VERLO|nr:hypothetical protein BN1708_015394 [Verticillium longisporum]
MPPKRFISEKPGSRSRQPRGYFASTYDALTSSENASIVRSVIVFGAAVSFLSSSWGEFLLPPSV